MSFLANPPTPTVTEEPDEAVVTNDGWFPDIDPADLRARTKLDGSVTPGRLRKSIINAVISVNRELAQYKDEQLASGCSQLQDVASAQVDGMSYKVVLYMRAIYASVEAEMVERYRDFDTTGAGDKEADKLTPRIDELRRDLRWAISDLLDIRRTTVELI
jgi:hypothetical protein